VCSVISVCSVFSPAYAGRPDVSLEALAVNCYFCDCHYFFPFEEAMSNHLRVKPMRLKLIVSAFALLVLVSTATQSQINFGKPKDTPPLENPYTVNVPREEITKQIQEVLQICNVEIDKQKTNVEKGRFVTMPWQFTRGVNTKTDLLNVSNLPAADARNWLKGRYTLEINILPLDEKRSQLQVIAYIQGQMADVVGTKWIDSPSNGKIEDDTLRGLAGKILGLDLSRKKNGKHLLMNCEY
jgi:hypothetical protein